MAGEQHPTSGARGSNPSPQGFPNRSPCSLSAQIAPLPAESATKLQQDQVSPRGKRLLSRMRPPQGGSFGNHRRRALLPRFLGSGTAFPSGGRLQAQHQARSSSCIAPPCRTLPGLGCRAGHRAAAPAQLSFYKPGKIKQAALGSAPAPQASPQRHFTLQLVSDGAAGLAPHLRRLRARCCPRTWPPVTAAKPFSFQPGPGHRLSSKLSIGIAAGNRPGPERRKPPRIRPLWLCPAALSSPLRPLQYQHHSALSTARETKQETSKSPTCSHPDEEEGET